MSFHHSATDIHIRQENGSTFLFCQLRNSNGGTAPYTIRLDDHIGNSDGWFIWGGVNFTQSAHNIQLENTDQGPKLTADLAMANGGSRGRQGMFLGDKIENRDGHLKFTGA